MNRARWMLGLGLLVALVTVVDLPAARAEGPGPAAEPAPGSVFDGRAIRRTGGTTDAPAPESGVTRLDVPRLVLSTLIVVGLIIGAAWVYRRLLGGPASAGTSPAVKLLSRTILAPRQQILLLRVGRRVVVVGESGGRFTTLCEIRDELEVMELVGGSSLFDDRVAAESERLDAPGDDRDTPATDASDGRPRLESTDAATPPQPQHAEISELLARVRRLRHAVEEQR